MKRKENKIQEEKYPNLTVSYKLRELDNDAVPSSEQAHENCGLVITPTESLYDYYTKELAKVASNNDKKEEIYKQCLEIADSQKSTLEYILIQEKLFIQRAKTREIELENELSFVSQELTEDLKNYNSSDLQNLQTTLYKTKSKFVSILDNSTPKQKSQLLCKVIEKDLKKPIAEIFESGIDVNYIHEGKPLYEFAIKKGAKEVAEKVLTDKNFNPVLVSGLTILEEAIDAGNLPWFKQLLDHKANPNMQNKAGETLLISMCKDKKKFSDEIFKILQSYSLDLNMVDLNGLTAFHHAAIRGDIYLLQLLLINGQNIDQLTDNGYKVSALWLAVAEERYKVVTFLLSRKANYTLKSAYTDTTILHLAVENNNLSMVKLLAGKKELINEKNFLGMTALHIAAANGNRDAIQELTDNNLVFDVNLGNNLDFNNTALHYALSNCQYSTAQLLIKYHANVFAANSIGETCHDYIKLLAGSYLEDAPVFKKFIKRDTKVEGENLVPSRGQMPVIFRITWCKAIINADITLLKILASYGYDIDSPILNIDDNLISGLWLASNYGIEKVVSFLLSKGASLKVQCSEKGRTPLHQMVVWNKIDILKLLMKNSTLEALTITDKEGYNCLHLAAMRGNINAIQLLLDGGIEIDIVTHNRLKVSALWIAANKGHATTVEYLIEHGADPSLIADCSQRSALLQALTNRNIEVVEVLLKYSSGLIKDLPDIWGNTSLMVASQLGHFKTVELLIQHGANVNYTNAKNFGNTALHYAAEKGNLDIIKLLVEHKADIYASLSDNPAQLPFHKAAIFNQLHVIQYFIEELNFNIDLRTKTGFTPLILASEFGNIDIIKYLLNRGSNLSLQNDYKQDAFLSAICGNKIEIVKLLVEEYGAGVHTRNTLGSTALHIAAEKGSIEMAKLLISYGVKTDILDNKGQHFFELAPAELKDEFAALKVEAVTHEVETTSDLQSVGVEGLDIQEVAEDIGDPTLLEVIGGIEFVCTIS